MRTARTATGLLITADEYNAKTHGHDLCCADPGCGAAMTFRRESLVQGAVSLRSACFVSHAAKDHDKNCIAYDSWRLSAKTQKSLHEAVTAGKSVLINVNIDLSAQFNGVSGRHKWAPLGTYFVSNYKTLSIKGIEQLLHAIETVRDAGGDAALAKTYLSYKKNIRPLSSCLLDRPEKYAAVFNKMNSLAAGNIESVTTFPHIILMTPTAAARAGGVPRATPVTLGHDKGKKLVITQMIDAADIFTMAAQRQPMLVLACPVLRTEDVSRAAQKLAKSEKAFIDMHWPVYNVNQITSAR